VVLRAQRGAGSGSVRGLPLLW